MTRFLIAIVTLAFFTGCIAPTEQLTPFPEDAEGPSPEEEAMRNFGNNNSFGTTEVIPFSENGVQFPESMSRTMLNVDLSSLLAAENIDSEIIRVPGSWVLTMTLEVDYGGVWATICPLLATLELGSGGARTAIQFNPSRFSQMVVPASNVRLYLTWDQELAQFSGAGKSVRVTALLQRSPFVENRVSRIFGVTTGAGARPAGPLVTVSSFRAPVPLGAKSWSFVGGGSIFQQGSLLEFDGGITKEQYGGPELEAFYDAGINVPIKGLGERFQWDAGMVGTEGIGFLRFNL